MKGSDETVHQFDIDDATCLRITVKSRPFDHDRTLEMIDETKSYGR